MKEKIKEYIKIELQKLISAGDNIDLDGVYPMIIEEVIGTFDDNWDMNGWQGDYWASTDKYEVGGCLYYGTATITLKEDI